MHLQGDLGKIIRQGKGTVADVTTLLFRKIPGTMSAWTDATAPLSRLPPGEARWA